MVPGINAIFVFTGNPGPWIKNANASLKRVLPAVGQAKSGYSSELNTYLNFIESPNGTKSNSRIAASWVESGVERPIRLARSASPEEVAGNCSRLANAVKATVVPSPSSPIPPSIVGSVLARPFVNTIPLSSPIFVPEILLKKPVALESAVNVTLLIETPSPTSLCASAWPLL